MTDAPAQPAPAMTPADRLRLAAEADDEARAADTEANDYRAHGHDGHAAIAAAEASRARRRRDYWTRTASAAEYAEEWILGQA